MRCSGFIVVFKVIPIVRKYMDGFYFAGNLKLFKDLEVLKVLKTIP